MVVSSFAQIAQVAFVPIGLLLKSNVAVGLQPVLVFHAEHEPFNCIPDEERQIEQFALLPDVYHLVVDVLRTERAGGEDELPERYCQEVLAKGNAFNLVDSFHCIVFAANFDKIYEMTKCLLSIV